MPQEVEIESSIRQFRKDLDTTVRLALEGRAKIAGMQAAAETAMREAALLSAQADELLLRR
jgi:hypothetical protein